MIEPCSLTSQPPGYRNRWRLVELRGLVRAPRLSPKFKVGPARHIRSAAPIPAWSLFSTAVPVLSQRRYRPQMLPQPQRNTWSDRLIRGGRLPLVYQEPKESPVSFYNGILYLTSSVALGATTDTKTISIDMTSCVVQVQELSRRLLKRLQPSLPTVSGVEDLTAARDSATSEALLKVCKRQIESSPRSSAPLPVEPLQEEIVTATDVDAAQWPSVTGCEGVRKALTFLRTSRQHALMLMLQNQWERAITVLEKIEKATESVSEQRRQVVIQQANAGRNLLVEKIQDLELTPSHRVVRFSDEVTVAFADDMDRKCDAVSESMREEMLVLRASRKIPQENLSEFWSE